MIKTVNITLALTRKVVAPEYIIQKPTHQSVDFTLSNNS